VREYRVAFAKDLTHYSFENGTFGYNPSASAPRGYGLEKKNLPTGFFGGIEMSQDNKIKDALGALTEEQLEALKQALDTASSDALPAEQLGALKQALTTEDVPRDPTTLSADQIRSLKGE
ncbi:conserved hypothetical protein, partial [Ricinus communis]